MKIIECREDLNIEDNIKIYYFKTNDCGVCVGMLEKLKIALKDYDINLYTIQVEDNPKLRGKYLIFTGPTLLLIKNENIELKESGFIEINRVVNKMKNLEVPKLKTQ